MLNIAWQKLRPTRPFCHTVDGDRGGKAFPEFGKAPERSGETPRVHTRRIRMDFIRRRTKLDRKVQQFATPNWMKFNKGGRLNSSNGAAMLGL